MESTNAEQSGRPGEASPERAELSEREREILVLVATGASNKEIAQRLVISPNTVKVHLRNVFAKIGVASRTEAALFAIRQGWVELPGGAGANGEASAAQAAAEAAASGEAGDDDDEPAGDALAQAEQPPTPNGLLADLAATASEAAVESVPTAPAVPAPRARPHPAVWIVAVLGVALVVALAAIYLRDREAPTVAATESGPTAEPRWRALADLPTARSNLAAITYENQIYAIGGETAEGVTGLTARYDPASNTWSTLTAKPVPVADVGAAVVGGLIYVPGGRLASGEPSNVLEVYDPRQDAWTQREPMPVGLSAYALAAFEGRLYLFGGWNGSEYVDSVLIYDPDQDRWETGTPLDKPRGFAGAATAGGKIYILGGTDGTGPLADNDEYAPERELAGSNPWRARAPIPSPRYAMGAASVVDRIYVVGGLSSDSGAELPAVEYSPITDQWHAFDAPHTGEWSGLGVAVVETNLLAIGGEQSGTPISSAFSYRAVYTILIPVVDQ